MNLLDCAVEHVSWGAGIVKEQQGDYIIISFSSGEKQFPFPDAFEKFLKCEDVNIQNQIRERIELKKQCEKQKARQKSEEISRALLDSHTQNSKKSAHPENNIAFKCNYCNGGKAQNGIGYLSVCSDDLIRYNIKGTHHSWCRNESSPCCQYYKGIISRKTLNQKAANGDFICYESQMLKNWTAYAGFGLTREKKRNPMTLRKVRRNGLSILTSREPYAPEKERFIFAVFLIGEAFEGDYHSEGYVKASSKYRISLTQEEAGNLLFWNYYHNETSPENPAWSQKLHRYISNVTAASILYDIWKVKTGTEDEVPAKEFLDYFCKVNAVDQSLLPVRDGALSR